MSAQEFVTKAWEEIAATAVDSAITKALADGILPPSTPDAVRRMVAAVESRLIQLLVPATIGVAASAVAVAAKAEIEIESLGHAPRCGRCGAVCVQSVSKQVDGPGTVTLSCSSPSCFWTLP